MEAATIWSAPRPVPPRVLILSWEYPPIVEGGLARHVRKLAEQLVAQGTDVHVLTGVRAGERDLPPARGGPPRRDRPPGPRAGLPQGRPRRLHLLGRPHERGHAGGRRGAGRGARARPRPLPRLAGGRRGAQARARRRRAVARDRPRDGVRPPPGLGGQAPAAPHPRGRAADGARRRPRDHLLALHAPPRRRRVRDPGLEGHGDRQRDRPERPAARRRPAAAARPLRAAGRAADPARRPARLREGLPSRARRAAGPGRAARQRALPDRRLGHRRGRSSRRRPSGSA